MGQISTGINSFNLIYGFFFFSFLSSPFSARGTFVSRVLFWINFNWIYFGSFRLTFNFVTVFCPTIHRQETFFTSKFHGTDFCRFFFLSTLFRFSSDFTCGSAHLLYDKGTYKHRERVPEIHFERYMGIFSSYRCECSTPSLHCRRQWDLGLRDLCFIHMCV